jgi:oligosaccharide repeat unit polymerase
LNKIFSINVKYINILIGIILLMIVYVLINFSEYTTGSLKFISIVSIILYLWYLMSWKLVYGSLLNPYILFLTAAIIFNLGHVLLYGLNLIPVILNDKFTNYQLITCILFINICLFFFHSGALLFVRKKINITKNHLINLNSSSALRKTGWFLLIISLIPALISIKSTLDLVLTYGYLGAYQQPKATSFSTWYTVLGNFIIPAAIFLLAGSKKNKSSLLISIIIMSFYSLIYFFMGFRSNAIMALMAYFWVYDLVQKRISRKVLILGGIFMLIVVFPLVSTYRDSLNRIDLSFGYLWKLFFTMDNPFVSIISEMGGTMATVVYTMNLVPAVRDFDWGLSYIYAALTVVPNLFWDIHPSIAHGRYSSWLTWQVDPTFAADSDGGLGFSFIAEFFANFGFILSPFIIFIFGIIFINFLNKSSNNLGRIAAFGSYLSIFLMFARGESVDYTRSLLWYSIVPYVIYCIICKFNEMEEIGKSRGYLKEVDLNKNGYKSS